MPGRVTDKQRRGGTRYADNDPLHEVAAGRQDRRRPRADRCSADLCRPGPSRSSPTRRSRSAPTTESFVVSDPAEARFLKDMEIDPAAVQRFDRRRARPAGSAGRQIPRDGDCRRDRHQAPRRRQMLQRSQLQAQPEGPIAMTPNKLIWKELWQRPTAMITCLLAITLGITALVAIRSVTVFSEQAVKQQLSSLGANVLLAAAGRESRRLLRRRLPRRDVARRIRCATRARQSGRRRAHLGEADRAGRIEGCPRHADRRPAAKRIPDAGLLSERAGL